MRGYNDFFARLDEIKIVAELFFEYSHINDIHGQIIVTFRSSLNTISLTKFHQTCAQTSRRLPVFRELLRAKLPGISICGVSPKYWVTEINGEAQDRDSLKPVQDHTSFR